MITVANILCCCGCLLVFTASTFGLFCLLHFLVLLQFDSLCQKIDIDRKGFVSMSHVLNSFQRLTPLTDKLDAVTAQNATVLLISICINKIASYNSTIIDALIALVSSRVMSSPSFSAFIEKLKTKTETSNQATRIVEDQLFVSDVLFELAKDYIDQVASVIDKDHRPFGANTPRKILYDQLLIPFAVFTL